MQAVRLHRCKSLSPCWRILLPLQLLSSPVRPGADVQVAQPIERNMARHTCKGCRGTGRAWWCLPRSAILCTWCSRRCRSSAPGSAAGRELRVGRWRGHASMQHMRHVSRAVERPTQPSCFGERLAVCASAKREARTPPGANAICCCSQGHSFGFMNSNPDCARTCWTETCCARSTFR